MTKLTALILFLLLPVIAPAKTEGGTSMAYVYKDKYGITHVTESKETAQKYGGGTYASYTGAHSGGYATDKKAAESAYQSAISGGGGYTPSAPASKTTYGGGYSTGTYSPAKYAAEALQRAAGHVQYFGSPEAYAQAIQQKGFENLTDREAAEAFAQSRPELFGGGGATATTKGLEIPNLYAIPPASGPMAEIMRESSTHPVAQAAAQAFYQYLHGQAGQTGITPEQAYQRAAEATYQNVLGGMSYPEAKQAYDAWVQQLQQYQLQQMQPIQQMQAQIAPLIEQLQREIQNVNTETAPLVMDAYNQVIGMIDKVQQDLISRFEQAGQGVDPATQAALASLKETVQRQRENLMEDLSRRGLLQSGIWLEMQDRLNRGELTEQQRLLATRLSDLQNQLNQALASLGEMRIQATQQFGAEQIRQMEAAAQRRQQAVEALTNAALKIQEQIAQQQAEAQKLAWEREKFYAPWTLGPTPAEMLPYQYPRAGELLPYELGPTPAQMLPYQYPTANALLPYTQGPTPYEQQRLSLEQQRLAQAAANAARRASAGGGISESEIKRQNLADAQAEIWSELNSGKSIYEVEAKIMQNANKYTLAGLDPMDLVDYAWYAKTGAPKPKPATTTATTGSGQLTQEEIQRMIQSMQW